jgi:hypothetical protein
VQSASAKKNQGIAGGEIHFEGSTFILNRFVFDVFYGVIEEMTRSRSILPILSTIIVWLCNSINYSASAFCVDNSCASHQVGDWNGRHLYTARSSPLASLTSSSGIESLDTCSSRTGRLPPVLQDMINERREYELKLGKAMDTLQTDYPQLLIKTPGEFVTQMNDSVNIWINALPIYDYGLEPYPSPILTFLLLFAFT